MTDADTPWTLEGLGAREAFPGQKEKLALFGQFVGDWTGEATFLKEDGSEIPGGRGEVHFRWILDGRAIQDVWMYEDQDSKRMIPGGTTIRFYDPEIDAWQSTWISPLQDTIMTFTGHQFEDEIILEARNKLGQKEHWIFFGIENYASFSWRAEASDDGGQSWKPYVRYRFRKKK